MIFNRSNQDYRDTYSSNMSDRFRDTWLPNRSKVEKERIPQLPNDGLDFSGFEEGKKED